MNQHRKGNAFKDIQVQGDPRLLGAITRREVRSPNCQITHTHSGTILTPKVTRQVAYVHPWKVTANNDDTVNVGFGSLLSYQENSTTLREFKYFAGTIDEEYPSVTVTGEGSIYGSILAELAATADINVNGTDSGGDTFSAPINRVFPDATQDIYFTFETTPPSASGTFYFELAKVNLVDDKAVIVRQILYSNPIMASLIEPP